MLIRLLTILISVSISFLLTSCSEQDRGIKELTPVEIAREYLLKIGYKVPVLYSDESYFLNYFTAKDSVYEGVGDSLVKYETESPYKECRRSDFCTQLLIARNGLVFIPFQVRSELGGEKGAYITAVIVDTIFNYAIGNLRLFHSSGLHKYDSSFTEPYDLKYKEKSVDESKKY